ncbi:putative FAD-dependent monooxygenase [Sphaerulina musiva]
MGAPTAQQPQKEQKHIHILIIGAGLTGLILAQALRKLQHLASLNTTSSSSPPPPLITYEIFERDPRAFFRGGGWSLTIHWALTDLQNLLPDEIMQNFETCLVNRDAAAAGQAGNFQFLNLCTSEIVEAWPIPRGAASRVSRERILELLMRGVDVRWSKHLTSLDFSDPSSVTATFADGSQAQGHLVIGCDGARSAVRRTLCATTWQNNRLPVRLLGLRVKFPLAKVAKCLAIDPHFFQGGDPLSNVYFWFSFIHLPRAVDVNAKGEEEEEEYATCQMMVSWPYSGEAADEMPETQTARRERILQLATNWNETFRDLVYSIPETTELREIVLEDWPPVQGRWDNHNGRVTLVGDAAHCMTMFRGEAANHGVIDVSHLIKTCFPTTSNTETMQPTGCWDLAQAVKSYEEEMITRTFPAVLKSRQACLDANHFASVNKESPLIAKRAMKE